MKKIKVGSNIKKVVKKSMKTAFNQDDKEVFNDIVRDLARH